MPGPCPEAVGPEAGAALGLPAGRAGRLLSGRWEAARAALKWARLISAFKCLQSYSKSSRRKGSRPRQPGTGVGRGMAGTPPTPSPRSPRPQAALHGKGVLPCSGRSFPSLTPAAEGCLLQPQSKPDFISRLQFPWPWATADASYAALAEPIGGPAHRAGCVRRHMTSCLRPAGAQGHPLPAPSPPPEPCVSIPACSCTASRAPCTGQHGTGGAGGSGADPGIIPALGGAFGSVGPPPPQPRFPLWSVESGCRASAECGLLRRHEVRPSSCCSEGKAKSSPLGTWMFPALPGQSWGCAALA